MEWETNPDGTIKTNPIVGWMTAAVPMNAMVQLQMLQPDESLKPIQFHLSAKQCRQLAEDLSRKAVQIEAQTSGSREQ